MAEHREQWGYYLRYAVAASLVIVGVLAVAMLLVIRMKQSHRETETARATYRAAAEGSLDAFFLLRTVKGRDQRVSEFLVEDANSRALQLLKMPREKVVGMRLRTLLPKLVRRRLYRRFFRVLETGEPIEEEIETDWGMQGARWFRHQVVPIDGGLAVTLRDIDDAKHAQQTLERAANLDSLTSLPNRRHFIEHARQRDRALQARGHQSRRPVHRPRQLQERQRHARPRRRRPAAAGGRRAAPVVHARRRRPVAAGRRRIHRHDGGRAQPGRGRDRVPADRRRVRAADRDSRNQHFDQRQHRRRVLPGGRRRRQHAAQERRPRDVRRQGIRQRRLPVLHPGDGRAPRGAHRHRAGPARRAAPLRAVPRLPAAGPAERRQGHRARGAGALAASGERRDVPDGFHSDCGGEQPHPSARRLRLPDRLLADPALAGDGAGRRSRSRVNVSPRQFAWEGIAERLLSHRRGERRVARAAADRAHRKRDHEGYRRARGASCRS